MAPSDAASELIPSIRSPSEGRSRTSVVADPRAVPLTQEPLRLAIPTPLAKPLAERTGSSSQLPSQTVLGWPGRDRPP